MSELTPSQALEFLAAIDDFYIRNDDSKLNEIFSMFDRDSNGTIDHKELKAVLTSVTCAHVDDEEVDTMVRQADANSDGKIDIAEFIAVMKRNRRS
jgi:calmodulin